MYIKYFEDEKLKFGNNVEAYDPRIGLLKGGPYSASDSIGQEEFKVIKCGIIGTSFSIKRTINLFERISHGLKANDNLYGSLGFPGLGRKSPLQFSTKFSKEWNAKVLSSEIQKVLDGFDVNEQKNSLFDLIESKLENIKSIDPPPDLILLLVEETILKNFLREKIHSDDIIFANRTIPNSVYESEGDINFHSIIKIIGMDKDVVTQIIKTNTLNFTTEEDEVTMAWNLAVSLYYKAEMIPWKFTKFEGNICYVGISFFRDFSQPDVRMNTSMAQVFLSTGESYILKGDSFLWEGDKEDLDPHLDQENSKKITNKVLEFYYKLRGNYPERLVIFKTSNFKKEEIEGIYSNNAKLHNIDMITIQQFPKIRLYRQTNYPVMRGTGLISNDEKECILFTTGYIPSYKTYPGMRAPKPILIRDFTGNSNIELISKEVLKLTRLDWNDIKFCHRLPVTITFPQKVGDILAERRARGISIKNHYRYYM